MTVLTYFQGLLQLYLTFLCRIHQAGAAALAPLLMYLISVLLKLK
jgi:hypothetical protein